MNESLQAKANKSSVLNALQRKANRSDIEQMLETKADMGDLDKILAVLESKPDQRQIDEIFSRQIGNTDANLKLELQRIQQ